MNIHEATTRPILALTRVFTGEKIGENLELMRRLIRRDFLDFPDNSNITYRKNVDVIKVKAHSS